MSHTKIKCNLIKQGGAVIAFRLEPEGKPEALTFCGHLAISLTHKHGGHVEIKDNALMFKLHHMHAIAYEINNTEVHELRQILDAPDSELRFTRDYPNDTSFILWSARGVNLNSSDKLIEHELIQL